MASESVEDPSSAPVKVMTVHRSKGLEFDIVVLPELYSSLAPKGKNPIVPVRAPDGRVMAVYPSVSKGIRAFFTEIVAAEDDLRAAELRDALGVLYVALIGWRLIPAARGEHNTGAELFDIGGYIAEVRVKDGSQTIGKRVRELDEIVDEADAAILGLVRRGTRLPGQARREVVRKGDILVVEAPPKAIEELVGALGLEYVGEEKHGGLIGTLLAMIAFARRRGFSPFSLFDVVTASAAIGIMSVRIANFINAELFGKTTDLPWAIIFPGGGPLGRHPSQLYEAALEEVPSLSVKMPLSRKSSLT